MPPTVPDTSRSVAVKVANGHDLHRIALPEPSFDALQIKVAEAFRRPKDAVHLVYAGKRKRRGKAESGSRTEWNFCDVRPDRNAIC